MTECSFLSTGEIPLGTPCSGAGTGGKTDYQVENVSVAAKSAVRPIFDNTVIIFDWDDTLLASSWLASQGFRLDSPVPKEAVDQLKMLETAVVNLLSKSFLFGEVHLVTNGETGWVEMSAQKFLPRVCELLPRVNIVSARSTYQNLFPDSPETWKVEAFRHTLHESFDNKMEVESKCYGMNRPAEIRNLISFGDSMHERNALKRVSSDMNNTYCKSIKFVERPTLEQLERQLKIISGSFEYVCTHGGNLDLMLVVEMLCN